jgi:hypothetical protein
MAKHLGLRVISMEPEDDVSGLLVTKPEMSSIVICKGDAVQRQSVSAIEMQRSRIRKRIDTWRPAQGRLIYIIVEMDGSKP